MNIAHEDRSSSMLLIAHSDPVVRLGLSSGLAQANFESEVLCCTPRDQRLGELIEVASVVVTDYLQGMALCAQRRADAGRRRPNAQIVVVSGRDGENDIRAAVDAGVKGYLLSGFEVSEFIVGIGLVRAGTRYLCNTAASKMVDSLFREALTAREAQVLRCLVDGYVNKRICEELDIALGTVKAHVKSIFSKLGVVTRTQAVALATRRGIVSGERSWDASALPRPAQVMPDVLSHA